MFSEDLIKLALKIMSCSQKELASQLGVSPTQISKWKKGEYMSTDMEKRIRTELKIDDKDPAFILWAGSLEQSAKWERLILFLSERAQEHSDTGYKTYPLSDEMGTLCWETFHTLKKMGVNFPKNFPDVLDIDYDHVYENDESDNIWDKLEENSYSAHIYKIYRALNDLYAFYAAYISELVMDDELDLLDVGNDIESCLMELAATKIEVDEAFAPNFSKFRYEVVRNYKEWLKIVKDKSFRAGVPLRAELMQLVYDSHNELGHEAEAESLGFNFSRIHPDVYMNELLCGMRVIHQVLPLIMKKLGIYDEYKVDDSDLTLG
jgi:transcriptional regulator with XRE-family HTH domain